MGKDLISNIKRAGYLGVVMALILSAMPVVPIGRVSAACNGPTTLAEINEILAKTGASGSEGDINITLCADIEGPINVVPKTLKKFSLNLNGFAITSSTPHAIVMPKTDVNLVIEDTVGTGSVNGKMAVMNADNLTITGGTYTTDPSAYVRDAGLKAYKVGDVYKVEPKLSDTIFKNIPDTLTIKEGEVYNLSNLGITLPQGSTSGVVYYVRPVDGEAIAKLDKYAATTLTGEKIGKTVLEVATTHDKSVRKNISLEVVSGLKDLLIGDVVMFQEDKKTVAIENVYHFDRASGVTYRIVSVSNDAIDAQISGDQLTVITGANGKKVEPGEYAVVVEALVNGEATGIKKNVKVTVNKLFTDFSLEQADENDVIEIREDKWFALKISGAKTENIDSAKVKITGIEVLSGGDVMHAKEDRIAGDKKGVGRAKIKVTAEYTSELANTYTLAKEFTVVVNTALINIAVREASDTNNKGVKYGSDTGEVGLIEIDKDATKDLKVSINKPNAGVDVKITSSDDAVAKVEMDGNNFTISSTKAGEATITVTVTPKNATDGAGALTKTFKVKVNPILEDIAVAIESGGRTMTEKYEIDNGDFGKIIATANDGLTEGITYTFEEIAQVKRLELDEDGSFKSGLNTKPETKIRITARDAKGREVVKDITIKINPVLNSLTLENDEITIYEEESAQIVIKKVVADSIKDKVVWSYEGYDAEIITVSDSGEIIGKKDGTTTVEVVGTFKSPLGETYTAHKEVKVTVKPLLKRVRIRDVETRKTLDGSTQTLYELDEMKYNITHENPRTVVEYRAESSNEDVATVEVVDGQLIVKTKENTEDTALIKVFARDIETNKEVFAKMTVKVKPTLKSISASDVHMRLADNEAELKVEFDNPAVTPEFTYESSDEDVATVVDGKIKALKAGKTTVTIKASYDGKNAETKVDVYVYKMIKGEANYYGEMKEGRNEITIVVDDAINETVSNAAAITHKVIGGDAESVEFSEDDKVTFAKPGKYEIKYTDTMTATGEVVDEYTATFEVFNLVAEAEKGQMLDLGDTYEYIIDPANTYGDVEVVITRTDENGNTTEISRTTTAYPNDGEADFKYVPEEEGKYTVRIENLSAKGHDFREVEKGEFYVVAREYDFKLVRTGTVLEITSDSIWSVDSARDSYNPESLTVEDGKVVLDTSDMQLGVRTVTLYHKFDKGQKEALKRVAIAIYDTAPESTPKNNIVIDDTLDDLFGKVEKLTNDPETLSELEQKVWEAIMEAMASGEEVDFETITNIANGILGENAAFGKAQEMFGSEWQTVIGDLNEAVAYGDVIRTRVNVEEITPETDVEAAILKVLNPYGVDSIDYYDVTVEMYVTYEGEGGEEEYSLGLVHKLNGAITVALAKTTDPETGYTRTYYVLRMHDGEEPEVLVEGRDFYIEDGVIYVISDKFSTYAVAYKDTLIPETTVTTSVTSPDTGASTSEGASASSNALVMLMAVMTAITLAGAAKIATYRRK